MYGPRVTTRDTNVSPNVCKEAGLLYELRIYECFGGRLPALNQRFNDHTTKLFEKHGIKNIGYWTNEVGPSSTELIYMIAFEDWVIESGPGRRLEVIPSGTRSGRHRKRTD